MAPIRALELLARLERLELDRRRQELAALDAGLAGTQAERSALRDRLPAEIDMGLALAGGPEPLGRWLAAVRRRERELAQEADRLAAERRHAAECLRVQHAAARRQELLVDRALSTWLARAVREERRRLDELAVLRHGRARAAGSEFGGERHAQAVELGPNLDLAGEA
jgi:hypothetical protein